MSTIETVKNRRALASYLDDCMNKAYRQLVRGQKLNLDTSLVKTYLVEAHSLKGADHDGVHATLSECLSQSTVGTQIQPSIKETQDRFFFNVHLRGSSDELMLYVDATNPRFWLVHSMGRSTTLDAVMQRVVRYSHKLDSAWLPIQLLERLSNYGNLRGLGLDYDRRGMRTIDLETIEAPVEFLKMQVWGNKAGRVLEILREEQAFADSTTLSKVKIKYWLDPKDETTFSIDDIKYDGKITARGTSFQSHITLVSNLYNTYSSKIQEMEQRFSIGYHETDDTKLRVTGTPISIHFPRGITDLPGFCSYVFSSSHPFRLWGVPTKEHPSCVRVSAVDLHVGKRVNFEITPSYMRIYLTRGACGNSLARLYTNLQHYYNSQVHARDESDRLVFEF